MSLINGWKKRKRRVKLGLDTRYEMFLSCADRLMRAAGIDTKFHEKARIRRLLNADDKSCRIKEVRLPVLSDEIIRVFFGMGIFDDTFCAYLNCNDNYDEKTYNTYMEFLNEGFYGLVNDIVSVTVEPGDIVVDAGSWIGDFSAYASVKGAVVYAFEPAEEIYKYTEKTAALNKNMHPVSKGLSDKNIIVPFFNAEAGDTPSSTFSDALIDSRRGSQNFREAARPVETVRLDDFVSENNIPRVDFIKADIQGFERNMLEGAQETLARFAPKLAICTYHLPDDPEVLARLIV